MSDQNRWAIIRGDDEERAIRLTDRTGDPLPLRDVTIVITAKPPKSDRSDDSDAIYRHVAVFAADGSATGAVGIRLGGVDPVTGDEVSGPDDGLVTEFLTVDDIAALGALYDATSGRGDKTVAAWDMQVTDAQGRKKTILGGTLVMRRDVGRVN